CAGVRRATAVPPRRRRREDLWGCWRRDPFRPMSQHMCVPISRACAEGSCRVPGHVKEFEAESYAHQAFRELASVRPHDLQHIGTISLELALADAADLRKVI